MQAFRLILGAVLAFAACASSTRAQTVTLTLVHATLTTRPAHQAALQFAKRAEERTERGVKIETFPAGQRDTENGQGAKFALDVPIGTPEGPQ